MQQKLIVKFLVMYYVLYVRVNYSFPVYVNNGTISIYLEIDESTDNNLEREKIRGKILNERKLRNNHAENMTDTNTLE